MAAKMTDDGMMVGAVVVISLQSPKERVWGLLLGLNQAGATTKATDLASFDDFVRQARDPEPAGLPTVCYPMARIERSALDEQRAGAPSLAQIFEQKVGVSLEEHLDSLQDSV